MKVVIKLNLGTRDYPDHPYKEGEVRDVPDELGEQLIARGFAVLVEAPKSIKTTPEPPAIAKAAEPAIKPDEPEVKPEPRQAATNRGRKPKEDDE